jgi:hypothetical protein
MSLHNRHSLNSGSQSEGRVSLNARDIADLPEEDFAGRSSQKSLRQDGNPLNNSLMSSEGLLSGESQASIMSDPTANPSTLQEQTWATQVFYSFFCIPWREKVFDRKEPLAPQMCVLEINVAWVG